MNASIDNGSSAAKRRSVYAPERAPFFVAAFGTSSPFAYWGFELLCDLVAHLTGGRHHIHGTSLEELREGWKERENGSVVFTTDFPESALRTFLLANRVHTVAFLDTPKDALVSAYRSRAIPFDEACRFATWTFAALADVFCDHRTLVIRRWRHKSVRSIVGAILAYLDGQDRSDSEAVDRAMAYIFPEALDNDPLSLEPHLVGQQIHGLSEDQTAELTAEDERIAEVIASSYAPLFNGERPKEIRWPPELFFTGDEQPILGSIELTGSARPIVWGPYLCLPSGAWQAVVTFEVLDNFASEPFITDVCAGDTLVEKTLRIPRVGIFAYSVQFEIKDPNESVEIRLLLTKGLIEGHFKLQSVVMTAIERVEEPHASTPLIADSSSGE